MARPGEQRAEPGPGGRAGGRAQGALYEPPVVCAQQPLCVRGHSPQKGFSASEGLCVRPGGGVSPARCPQRPPSPLEPRLLSLSGRAGSCTPLVVTAPLHRDGCRGTARVLGSCRFDQPCARLLLEREQREVSWAPVTIPCSAVPGSPAVLSVLSRQLRTVLAVQDVQGSMLEVVPAHGSAAGTR